MCTATVERKKGKVAEISKLISKLSPEQQEYISGYVQGLADAANDRNEQKTA